MSAYIIRRLLLMIPTFLLLTILVFLFIHPMPGSVIDLIVMQHAHEQTGQMSTVDVNAIRHLLGLDKSLRSL